MSLPGYLLAEEAFADWCRERGVDETDDAWVEFCAWVDDHPRHR